VNPTLLTKNELLALKGSRRDLKADTEIQEGVPPLRKFVFLSVQGDGAWGKRGGIANQPLCPNTKESASSPD